jgi:hypothetical protein
MRQPDHYSGNPPHKISSEAARWCAQNRSAVLLSVSPVAVALPPVPPGLLLPVAVLCIPSVTDSEIRMTTVALTPAPTTFHGGSLARRDEPHVMYKIDGKPKIDINFLKSMAQSIQANRGGPH